MSVRLKDNSSTILAKISRASSTTLTAIGIQAQMYATYLCPVDTGRLRGSIAYIVQDDTVHIGTNVEYAPYVEKGTRKMKAQPFLTPAITDHQSDWEEIAEKYFGKI